MTKLLAFFALSVLAISCASQKANVDPDSVKEISRFDVESKVCRDMDLLTGTSERGSEGEAIGKIQKKAAMKGYRFIKIEEKVQNGASLEVKATAYECKK